MTRRLLLFSLAFAFSLRAAIPQPDAVLATIDGTPVTRAELAASLPDDVRREYESKFSELAETKARAVRDVLGRRTIASEAKQRNVSEADVIASEFKNVLAEIDPGMRTEITKGEEEIYNAEKIFLQRLVDDRKLARAAAAKHLTTEELSRQIESSIAPVTKDDIQFAINYEINRRRTSSSSEPPEKQVERAIRNARIDQKKRALIDALPQQPRVAYLVQPPRLTVSSDDDPVRGAKNAPVQIVEFSDFQCQYCAQAEPILARLQQVYGDKVAVTFRDYPLPIHPLAMTAAKAANCAAKSGKYWEFHDALFAGQADLSRDRILQIGQSLGLPLDSMAACFDDPSTFAEIQSDVEDGHRLGIEVTPTFFVNGRMLSGSQTLDHFVTVIEDELGSR
ncbi:MAG TPA: thioredoxin domain-containing protein [Thermoanaerobaculia bacterium]|nr:thioredoxin domain-containing protein [Thermoanaerobaculia bacterium]